MRLPLSLRHLGLVGLCCVLIAPLGCSGGGSSGTGGLRIDGTVLSRQGAAPLSGLTVTVSQTGDSAVTDMSGTFSIATSQVVGDAELLIESSTLSSRAQVSGIPSDASVVTVRISVDESTEDAEVEDVQVERRHHGGDGNGGSGGSGGSGASGGSGGDDHGSGGNDDSGDDHGGAGTGGNGGHGGHGNDDGGGASGGSGATGGSGGSGGSGGGEQEIEVTGAITALSATSVTVQGNVFTVDSETDFGHRSSLSQFSVGEIVDAKGRRVNGVLFADRVRLDD